MGRARHLQDPARGQKPDSMMSDAGDGRQTWWERFPGVFIRELEEVRRHGFRPRLGLWNETGKSGSECLIASGRVRIKAAKPGEGERWRGLDIDIAYPPNYPFDKLDVRPRDPKMRRRRHQTTHTGDLCYMQEEVEAWALGYGIGRAIDGAKDWFHGVITGRFENEVPAAELLAYLEQHTQHLRAVLIPPHAISQGTSRPYGKLELECDPNSGLSVINVHQTDGDQPSTETRSTNDRIWRSVRRDFQASVAGLWFSLNAEPSPFTDIEGLEAALAEHAGISSVRFRDIASHELDPVARRRGWLPIALNYPVRDTVDADRGGREWLFLCMEWPDLPDRFAKARRLRSDFWDLYPVLKGLSSYSVDRPDLLRRVGELYPVDSVSRAHVVVIGIGALGSTVARSLAAAGVQHFTLVDPDIVKPGNVVRHEARMPDVGRAKVHAMEQILRETNPYVVVEVNYGTRGDHAGLERVITNLRRASTLIVATVGLKAVDAQVEDFARRADPPVPVLHGWVMAQAQVLRAFVYRSGQTACVWCNGLYDGARREGEENGYIVEPDTDAPVFYETSCASPAFPGAGNSNALAAHIIVEMALDVLHDRLPNEESHWIFAGNKIRELDADFPVAPLTIERKGFRPHPECPVCSEGVISDKLNAEERETYDHELARLRGAA